MTDLDYWRQRAEAAEAAMHKARSALVITTSRRDLLAALGDLRSGEWLTAKQLGKQLSWTHQRCIAAAGPLARAGMVEIEHPGRGRGKVLRLRLGYMVQIPPLPWGGAE